MKLIVASRDPVPEDMLFGRLPRQISNRLGGHYRIELQRFVGRVLDRPSSVLLS